jgi:hypothetical protein
MRATACNRDPEPRFVQHSMTNTDQQRIPADGCEYPTSCPSVKSQVARADPMGFPKLRTRVRFPSPALVESPNQRSGVASATSGIRHVAVPFRAIRRATDADRARPYDSMDELPACHARAIYWEGAHRVS